MNHQIFGENHCHQRKQFQQKELNHEEIVVRRLNQLTHPECLE